jgi:hypothetical protein
MTRLTLVLLTLSVAGCFQSHPSDRVELMGKDCNGCHAKDWLATTAPVHPSTPQVFSTACVNCHRTVSWQPALEGLHSETFLMATGAHAPIACLDCHDLDRGLPSKAGANTNCIQCHPDDAHQRDAHVGVTSLTNTPYVYQADVVNFCLQCHPSGVADKHPDDLFARRGNHDVPCADCHDRSSGPDTKGRNVTCVDSRCHHTLAFADGVEDHRSAMYQTARGDGSSRNFCHQCHK